MPQNFKKNKDKAKRPAIRNILKIIKKPLECLFDIANTLEMITIE